MTPQTAVNRALEAELAATGHTKGGLAKRLGIDRRNLYMRLAGHKAWSIDELDIAADYVGLTIWKLLDAAEKRQSSTKREPVAADSQSK